jgi:hypothetical protein
MFRINSPIRYLTIPFVLVILARLPAIAIDWPTPPRDQAQPVGNAYGQYQYYGAPPYLHPGIDILRPPSTPVYAVKSGYVKAVLTTSGSLYWRVSIGDSAGAVECDGWLYAHIEPSSIPVLEGEWVNEGDYLGDLVTWPVANFHHLHFSKIRSSGTVWASDWDFIGNPVEEFSNRTDPTSPVIEAVAESSEFAFRPNDSDTYFSHGATLYGDVDIIAHIHDRLGYSRWDVTPYQVTYEIFNDTFSTGPITSIIYTGFLNWTENVNVTYADDPTYNTRGDYDFREFYFIVTNTDGDSVVEASDLDCAWETTEFSNGRWWVKVTAYDLGGNVTADSMQVTVGNNLTTTGTAVPCDADPDSSGAIVIAPDLPGAPQTTCASDGSFFLPDLDSGDVRIVIMRDYYQTVDTFLTYPGAVVNVAMQPDYLVGDLNGDSFSDPLDLARLIDILFAGSTDWPTPYWSGDLDFDRFFTPLDLAILIDYLYASADPPGPARCWP